MYRNIIWTVRVELLRDHVLKRILQKHYFIAVVADEEGSELVFIKLNKPLGEATI